MKSKGQAETQGFIFILAIIVGSLTLLLGYQGIKAIMNNIESAELNTFHKNFESEVSLMSSPTKFGSVKILELDIPENYDELCVVDSDLRGNPPDELKKERPLIWDSLKSGNKPLAFLFGKDFQPYTVGNITIISKENKLWECGTPVAGIIKLKLAGKGREVQVSFIE